MERHSSIKRKLSIQNVKKKGCLVLIKHYGGGERLTVAAFYIFRLNNGI